MACVQLCAKKCISMQDSEKGFRYPRIDAEACVECGACMKACHQLDGTVAKNKPLKVYAAWHKDKVIHAASSSGGAFTAIADAILDRGGVVFGASACADGHVHHIYVEHKKDLARLRGSKYVQSDLADSYSIVKNLLRKGRQVLFVGSPCQVAGLYAYLRRRYENLCTCDFICHGVPSQNVLDIYKLKIAKPANSIVAFRDNRVCGYRLTLNDIPVSPVDDYYMRAFNKGLMFMDACYTCQYATPERVADFTIGDFWGIGVKKPFNHHHPLGISLLMVNSPAAQELMPEMAESLHIEERDLDEAVAGNHNLSKTSVPSCDRSDFYKDFEMMNKWKLMSKYRLYPSLRDMLRPIKRIWWIYKMKWNDR